MVEQWKQIEGFPRYEVSDLGRIRSYASKSAKIKIEANPHILKQTVRGRYYCVRLHRQDGFNFIESVHVIVLEAFVGPRPNGCHGCHNDGDPLNNHLDNLRWDTVSDNHFDKLKHGTMYNGESHHFTKFTEDDIRNIRKRAATGETHRSIADDYKVTRPTISYIVRRFTWKHVE